MTHNDVYTELVLQPHWKMKEHETDGQVKQLKNV